MTEEEKKAQEEAAAAAAQTENAGGETGGDAGNQGNNGGEGGTSNGQGEGEQKAAEKTPREVIFERVRTSRPDANYDEDEEEIYRQLTSMLDEAEEGSGKYKGLTEKLMRRYEDDPEEVAALLDYMEGMPLIDAIVKHKGEEALTMHEGDEGWDSYQETVKKRKEDRERYQKLMEEVEGNMNSSVEEFNAWADELGLDDEKRQKIWDIINGDLDNMSRGKFGKEILNRYRSAIEHDSDVDGAYEQGKADGKNESIEAKQAQMKGSGLPGMPAGGSKKEEKEQKKGNATADWLSGFRHK